MSSLSKLILILGKARITECQIGAVGELSHLGDLIFHQKTLQETWCMSGPLLWWSCQSPVAHSCRLLNSQNSFHGGMFKLNTKSDADSLLYLVSHFEYSGHTVYTLTQWHLPSPLTSTVKSWLFTRAHSSPLSSAARLHGCHANHSHYINNGWTFSRHTILIWYFKIHAFMSFLSTFSNWIQSLKSVLSGTGPISYPIKVSKHKSLISWQIVN